MLGWLVLVWVSSLTEQTSLMMMLNSRVSVRPFQELYRVILALNVRFGLKLV